MCTARNATASSERFRCSPCETNRGQRGDDTRWADSTPSTMVAVSSPKLTRPVARVRYHSGLTAPLAAAASVSPLTIQPTSQPPVRSRGRAAARPAPTRRRRGCQSPNRLIRSPQDRVRRHPISIAARAVMSLAARCALARTESGPSPCKRAEPGLACLALSRQRRAGGHACSDGARGAGEPRSQRPRIVTLIRPCSSCSKQGGQSSWPFSRRIRVSMVGSPQTAHSTEVWIRAGRGVSTVTSRTS